MSIDLNTLKEPVFIENNWEEQYRELITSYESITGVTLSKGQLESIILGIFAYRENILRIVINDIAKQNLLAYARGEVLDHLGALLGCYRLSSRSAITTIRLGFSEALPAQLYIQKGIRIMSKDEKVIFTTINDVTVESGMEEVEILAEADISGAIGNGYMPGDCNILIDPIPYVDIAENITITYGGADEEDDEHFRNRIQTIPESFSNAGSKGAYEYWARTAHQDIVDAAVLSPQPGQVKVVVLMKNGEIPSQEIINLVAETLNDEKVRPLTDEVIVSAPIQRMYNISVYLYIYKSALVIQDIILDQAKKNIENYYVAVRNKLGQDIVPEQIISTLQKISGVYRAVVIEPSYLELTDEEVAICQAVDVVIAGSVEG